MSKLDKLEDWFIEGKSLTVVEAIEHLGIYALSQRVGDLKKRRGMRIDSYTVLTSGGARVNRYYRADK